MARKLISGNDVLSFSPATGIIQINGYIPLSKLLLVNNATKNVSLFNFSDPNTPATVTYDSEQNITSIDVSYNTTTMSSSDKIQVYYEKEELEIKPARTYRDPVSKMRVSNPQTLIDTDFEYGSQPTKWETVKLINNVPTSYSSPFTENAISIASINVSNGDNIMTVKTNQQHNLPIGGVVEITGLTDSKYEGTFIVKTSSSTQFSVKIPFNANKTTDLSTIYSTAYKGAFYTGSSIATNDVTTSTGVESTLTVITPNLHGFKNNTKLYLKNSRATKKFEFNVPSAVVGIGSTQYRSEISGIGGSPEEEYYSKNKIIAEEFIGSFEINLPDVNFNTSSGIVTYSLSTQFGSASRSGISTDDVLIFYTPEGNFPIQKPGSPSSVNVPNFTPFRVVSADTTAGIVSFTFNDAYNSSLPVILAGDGTNQFGNHRFIKGYRISEFIYPYTIVFDKETDFQQNDLLILNTNYTTSTFDSYSRSYLTKYNGEYNTSSYPYYKYTITSVGSGGTSVTIKPDWTYFNNRKVKNDVPGFIWAASKVVDHPLSNSLYLAPSAGFSTDTYDNYQYVLYRNTSSASRLPSLSDNTNYILQQVSNKKDWYRIYRAENNNDTTANWNTPIDIYFNPPNNPNNPSNTNGTAINVLSVGIHTITSALRFKNANTISLPSRGGLENNAQVVYNSNVSSIGNLEANATYNIKTEDNRLDANRFRLSTSTDFVKVYGIEYSTDQNFMDIYIYDLEDRVSADLTAVDGIIKAGIAAGNVIQISGSDYSNPVKKYFINNSFRISSVNTYTSVTKQNASSAANTYRYVYRIRVDVPRDGTFNTKTAISVFITQNASALQNIKITSIKELDTSVAGIAGTHILTQNIDGAVDDIYTVTESQNNSFVFKTLSDIPEITKNITSFSAIGSGAITFGNTNARLTVTNNGATNVSVANNNGNTSTWVSTLGNTGYTAPISVSFQLANAGSYYFAVGLTDLTSGTNINYAQGYTIYQYSGIYVGGNYVGSYTKDTGSSSLLYDLNSNHVYKVFYDIDGYVKYYRNGVQFDSQFIGTGKTLRPYVCNYDYFYTYNMSASNIIIGDRGLPFTANVTNYLKLSSHNFSDGAEVTFKAEPPTVQSILPLVHNQKYYVRVLDGDYVGLTSTLEDAIDRTKSLIGFSTSGISTATYKLVTNSIRGYLIGKGSVAITTTSSLVNGTNTNFLTDFTTGDVFRVYKLGSNQPGNYFESKIASIKGDKVLKLESIPSFENTSCSYFKETNLYPVSDGKIVHRPFDGGVAMYTGLLPNSKVIRQSRKYFRYQSGKGIQVSMAVNFNPTSDINTITSVGTGLTSIYNIQSKFPHNISTNAPQSSQRIRISNYVGAGATFFNRKSNETGFPIVSVIDDFNFRINIGNRTNITGLTGFPHYTVQNWQDASLKAGLFDDQNGFFFEYDGTNIYAVRRSSTQQISGRFETERNSTLINGQDSILTSQLSDGDSIVIRGQTYKVIKVLGDTSISIQPAYRGNASKEVVISKTIDTKIPQSQWNIDRMDGTGDSGYKIDISTIQMIYMDYSWYGAGSIRFGFKDIYGEVRYCHEFIHNNVFTESYFRSGNIPARYEVETFDDPLYSPALSHWGVSVIMDGRFDDDKAYLFTADSKTLPFTNDGYSSVFTASSTIGDFYLTNISSTEYSQLVVGQELFQHNSAGTPAYNNIQKGTKIVSLEIDTTSYSTKIPSSSIRYKIKMDRPAIATGATLYLNSFSGTSSNLQSLIPLVSIRLAPSVDNSSIGNLGVRDIINRMQLTLKSAGVLTTHDCEVKLVLNGKLSDESFTGAGSPSLSQIYKHNIGDTISEGIIVYSFRAQGGGLLAASATTGLLGRRSLSGTEVSLDELALLGNSILGGDNTYPDGPDILTLCVQPIDTSTISGASPMIITGRISWAEAQA